MTWGLGIADWGLGIGTNIIFHIYNERTYILDSIFYNTDLNKVVIILSENKKIL